MRKLTLILTFLLFVGFQAAAQMQITGTVTNAETGEPIPGASVVVKSETTIGTTTDMDGNYTLDGVPSDAETLVFSFVGMQEKEVAINGRTTIDVELAPSVEEMEEVVVTAVGMEKETKKLGYSVSEVSGESLEESGSSNAFSSLKGKVSGVQISQSSGTAGASQYIEVRGSNSITGNNDPLYVIDGQPIDNSGGGAGVGGVVTSNRAMDLNPDDIESINILKGGSATALYGMRGANGVVVIETKSGQKGEKYTNVDINSWVKISEASQMPDRQDQYVQGHNYFGTFDQPYITHPDNNYYAGMSWGPHKDDVAYTKQSDYLPISPYGGETPMNEYIDKWDPNGRMIKKSNAEALGIETTGQPIQTYDAMDQYLKTGISWKTHASVTSGDENTSFYLSASTNNNESIIPNNEWDKNSFKIKASHNVAEDVTITGSVNLVNTQGNRVQRGSNISGVMLGLLRTPPTFDNSYGFEFADGSQRSFRGGSGYDNPYWTSKNIHYQDNNTRAITNGELQWEINDWMNFSYRIGFDYWSEFVHNWFAKGSNENSRGYKEKDQSTSASLNQDLILTISRDLTEDLGVDATLGHNLTQDSYTSTNAAANGLIEPDFYNVNNSAATEVDEYTQKYRRMGAYAEVTFDYMDMLYLGGTGRFDWSTTMPEDQNPFFYPSANLGFVFTELPGFDSNFLSFGKLRASHAITASSAGPYNTVTTYGKGSVFSGWTTTTSFPFLGYTGYDRSYTIGNQDLVPEKQITSELGVDLRFFDGSVRFDATYFINRNEDLLMSVPIAVTSGFGSAYLNSGSMESKGFELMLNVTAVETEDFNWNFDVTWSNPETEVTKLAEGVDNVFLGGFTSAQVQAVEGEPYRSIYTTEYLKDDQGRMVISDKPSAADYQYGAPIWDETMKSVGKVPPKWTAGFTNRLSYNGLSLNATLDFKKGGLMWNGTKGAMYYFGVHGDQLDRGQEKVWEGVKGHLDDDGNIVHYDENGNVVDGPGETNNIEWTNNQNFYHSGPGSGFTGPGNPFIESSEWIRLREVTLSYSLPQNLLENSFFRKAQVYFTGNNLWLSTPYTGIDPETNLLGADSNSRGQDYFNMPGTKTYTFGVRLGF